MSILRKKSRTGYTHIDNELLNADGLSFRAKGIAAFLMSKPDNWSVRIDYLARVSKEGEQAIRTAMQELASAGFLMRERVHNEKGHLSTITHIADYPVYIDIGTVEFRVLGYETDATENGSTVNGSTVNGSTETGGVIVNTDVVNTDVVNPEREKTDSTTSSRKRGGGKATEDVHPNTKQILEAYVEELGYKPSNYAAEGKAAKQAAKEGYMPDDIRAAYQLIKAQTFWQTKHLSLSKLVTEIPALHQAHLKGVSLNGNERMSPADKLRAMLIAQGREDVLHG